MENLEFAMAGRPIQFVSLTGRALKFFGPSSARADSSRLARPDPFIRSQKILRGNERHLVELDIAASVGIGMPVFRDGFSKPKFRRQR
jgi:hypothetical protein